MQDYIHKTLNDQQLIEKEFNMCKLNLSNFSSIPIDQSLNIENMTKHSLNYYLYKY